MLTATTTTIVVSLITAPLKKVTFGINYHPSALACIKVFAEIKRKSHYLGVCWNFFTAIVLKYTYNLKIWRKKKVLKNFT